MRMTVEILEQDSRYEGIWRVRVPGIYGTKGDPLPQRMSKLVLPAAEALQRVYAEVTEAGGHLYLSDMFRSAQEQQRAHEDWKSGRKTAYSPPSCGSVHEAGRAIDIDAFDTGIGHALVRESLNRHGWVNIVETLTGAECWHYEFREARWEEFCAEQGYAAMARGMKEEIGNRAGRDRGETEISQTQWLQAALNLILGLDLEVDGVYGALTKEAVRRFQEENGLQIDGIAGPITQDRIEELLSP